MNAAKVLHAMQQAPQKITEYLLSAGRKRGGEWCVGDLENNEGQSLRISLKAKPLVWIDHATGQGGGGLDLWMAVRCVTLPEALTEVKQFLALRDEPGVRMLRAKTYRKPLAKVSHADIAVVAWFAARGILTQTLRRWKVRTQNRGPTVFAAIPSIGSDGKPENVKYRNLADKRDMRQEPDCAPALVGKHLLTGNETTITITEGECDAMVLDQMGIRALSMPNGANGHEWIAYEWPLLEQYTDIILAYDDDEAGHKGCAIAAQRLGIERCRVMRFGGAKDANDWLRAGATREDFLAAHSKARSIDPVQLHSIAEYATRIKARMNPGPDAPTAPLLQIDVDFEWLQVRPGEVTLWTGINGHGKSLLLSQVSLGQMRQGQSFCVFSGEMQIESLLARMVRQAAGLAQVTDPYIDAICEHYGEQFFIYEPLDGATSAPLDDILAVFVYAARRYGVNEFLIDSLMKTDVPEDGPKSLTAQKEAMNKITAFARRHNCHIHVVAHPRKDRDESSPPGKMDVSGSGRIVDQVDNVMSVWRKPPELAEKEPDKPSSMLFLFKQRDAGKPQYMKVSLWLDLPSLQFRTSHKLYRPQRYVEFDGTPVYAVQPEVEAIDDEVPEEDRF